MGQERLLAVFEAVASNQPASLSAVGTSAAVPLSTAHRSLGVLAASGWVRTVGPGRPRWVVTERIRALVADPSADLVALARPVLTDLALAAGESAALWLADGDSVVAVATAAPASALRVVIGAGHRTPAHACAPGKVVLAARTDSEVRLAAARGLAAVTMRTIDDPEQLLVELRRVRSLRVAAARGEEADGVTSVAVPIESGRRGAIGVVGPSDRVDARYAELVGLLGAAVEVLSEAGGP